MDIFDHIFPTGDAGIGLVGGDPGWFGYIVVKSVFITFGQSINPYGQELGLGHHRHDDHHNE